MVKTLQQVGYEPSRFYVTVFKSSTSGSSIIKADRARSHEISELVCPVSKTNFALFLYWQKNVGGGDLAGNNTKKKNNFNKSGNGSMVRAAEWRHFVWAGWVWIPPFLWVWNLSFFGPDVVILFLLGAGLLWENVNDLPLLCRFP